MTRPQAVIFDMDGVILDSERTAMLAWKRVGAERGLKDIDRVLEECTGINEPAAEAVMKRAYGRDFDFYEWKRTVNRVRLDICGGAIPPKPGAEALLGRLREWGIPRALASSTRSSQVERELTDAGLIGYFDAIVCGDMVERSKPAPDIFLAAARALSAEPSRCVVVEDSPNGLRAAAAAGMYPVLVPDRMPVTEEMRRIAGAVVPSLTALIALLEAA
ncbi:MAG: HAD family phosphatase [Clostridia bacterium]|nr:HAD family phosphatase [Clostridia bacterium]